VVADPASQVVGRGVRLRVDPADAHEPVRVGLQHVGDVPAIPAVVDRVNQHRLLHPAGLHEPQQGFRQRVVLRRVLRLLRPGIPRVVLPDVNVGFDDGRRFLVGRDRFS
jgi:hypothetical protein